MVNFFLSPLSFFLILFLFLFYLVEWSEQLRPVTSVRLDAVRRRVQIRLCTEQRV